MIVYAALFLWASDLTVSEIFNTSSRDRASLGAVLYADGGWLSAASAWCRW